MPVSVKDLQSAARPLAERLVEILRADPEKAFDIIDLFALSNGFDPRTAAMLFLISNDEQRKQALMNYEVALRELVEKGTVNKLEYRAQPHYFFAGRAAR